jgi:hypothetical protein
VESVSPRRSRSPLEQVKKIVLNARLCSLLHSFFKVQQVSLSTSGQSQYQWCVSFLPVAAPMCEFLDSSACRLC